MKNTLKLLCGAVLVLGAGPAGAAQLLNASYDVARALYKDLNPAFVAEWKKQSGEAVDISQSHEIGRAHV